MPLSEIKGQQVLIEALRRAWRERHFANYLFAGPEGVGKRTTGMVFTQAINCPVAPGEGCGLCPTCQGFARLSSPDLRVVIPLPPKITEEGLSQLRSRHALGQVAPRAPASSSISIEEVRKLKHELSLYPTRAKYRVVLILSADRFTEEAANAFLKILEEPPERSIFILTTSRLYKLAPTIRSRCQLFRFAPLPRRVLLEIIKRQTPQAYPPQVELAVELAEGSAKLAFELLADPSSRMRPEAEGFLSAPPKDDLKLLDLIKSLNPSLVEPFLHSLITGYRQALYLKLGLVEDAPIPARLVADRLSEAEIAEALRRSLLALSDLASQPNPTLFLFDLLSSVG